MYNAVSLLSRSFFISTSQEKTAGTLLELVRTKVVKGWRDRKDRQTLETRRGATANLKPMRKGPAMPKRALCGRYAHREHLVFRSHVHCQAMQATMPRENGDEALVEEDIDDDDELLSDPDAGNDSSVEGEEEPEADADGDEFGDGISLAEGSDDDDLVALDDVPDGLIEYDGSDAEAEQDEEEWGGIAGGNKRKQRDKNQSRRKKRKTLPTFATYEEYAKMIEDGPEDDI